MLLFGFWFAVCVACVLGLPYLAGFGCLLAAYLVCLVVAAGFDGLF